MQGGHRTQETFRHDRCCVLECGVCLRSHSQPEMLETNACIALQKRDQLGVLAKYDRGIPGCSPASYGAAVRQSAALGDVSGQLACVIDAIPQSEAVQELP